MTIVAMIIDEKVTKVIDRYIKMEKTSDMYERVKGDDCQLCFHEMFILNEGNMPCLFLRYNSRASNLTQAL